MKFAAKQSLINRLKTWGWVFLYLGTWFALVNVLSAPLYFIFREVKFFSSQDLFPLLRQLAVLLATLLVTIVFCNFVHKEKFMAIGLNAIKARWKDLLFGMLYGVFPISLGFMLCYAGGLVHVTEIRFVSGILFSFILFVVIAFGEEIMLRGYVLRQFMASYNKYIALIVSSVLFMLMHVFNKNISFLGLLNIFLAGVLLGMYYIHRKNLWFPIGLHFTWNFFQGPVFGFAVSGGYTGDSIISQQAVSGKDWLTGGAFGFEGSAIAGIIVAILIMVVHFQYRKKCVISKSKAYPIKNRYI